MSFDNLSYFSMGGTTFSDITRIRIWKEEGYQFLLLTTVYRMLHQAQSECLLLWIERVLGVYGA